MTPELPGLAVPLKGKRRAGKDSYMAATDGSCPQRRLQQARAGRRELLREAAREGEVSGTHLRPTRFEEKADDMAISRRLNDLKKKISEQKQHLKDLEDHM